MTIAPWLLLGDRAWDRVAEAAAREGRSVEEFASSATGRPVGRVWRESELREPRLMRAVEYRPYPAWTTYGLRPLGLLCVAPGG